MNFLVANKLLSSKQYGFIPGRSTELQLLTVLDHWTKCLELGGQVDVIYTDFEKAFDRVPHQRLLCKLGSYGVEMSVVKWIENFLCFRQFQVRVNGTLSQPKDVISGIPQGSVLGPLLFVVYINDLPDVCGDESDILLFADDAKLYKHIQSPMDSFILYNDSCKLM